MTFRSNNRRELASCVTMTRKIAASCAFLWILGIASARGNSVAEGSVEFAGTPGAPGLMTLEAKQAPLARVFDEIARKTGVRIHYSALPGEPATATCAGETLERIMSCLLGSDANLAYRYPERKSGTGGRERPQDIWVLGSSFARNCSAAAASSGDARAENRVRKAAALRGRRSSDSIFASENPAKLLEMAQAENPARRANAIARLTAAGNADEATVRDALERAFSDENPQVRAQAVNGLARRGIGDVAAMLRAAMSDGDSSVRLMAVDNMSGDAAQLALLRAALADPDETVSYLAALKLKAFER
jgi:hypothetical protein